MTGFLSVSNLTKTRMQSFIKNDDLNKKKCQKKKFLFSIKVSIPIGVHFFINCKIAVQRLIGLSKIELITTFLSAVKMQHKVWR